MIVQRASKLNIKCSLLPNDYCLFFFFLGGLRIELTDHHLGIYDGMINIEACLLIQVIISLSLTSKVGYQFFEIGLYSCTCPSQDPKTQEGQN